MNANDRYEPSNTNDKNESYLSFNANCLDNKQHIPHMTIINPQGVPIKTLYFRISSLTLFSLYSLNLQKVLIVVSITSSFKVNKIHKPTSRFSNISKKIVNIYCRFTKKEGHISFYISSRWYENIRIHYMSHSCTILSYFSDVHYFIFNTHWFCSIFPNLFFIILLSDKQSTSSLKILSFNAPIFQWNTPRAIWNYVKSWE